MKSMLEKIALSLLITTWLVYGSHTIGNMLVHTDEGDIDALRIVSGDSGGAEEASEMAASEPEAMDVMGMLASADVEAGEKTFKKCKSCHSIESGGKNKVGPNLWNIVGSGMGSVADFKYSSAITGLGGTWTFESLDSFLADPKAFAPGTKMSFKGVKDPAARAALIVYLHAQSDSPVPLP